MTLQNKINELKAKYPSLTKGINDEVIELSIDEYDATIKLWAENELAEEAAKLAQAQLRQTKIDAYKKLGLSDAEIEALLPTPIEPQHNS